MEHEQNSFKRRLLQGELQTGLWSSLCSPTAAEILADSAFDWRLIDTEHSPNEAPDVLAQLRSMARGSAAAIVGRPGTIR